MAANICVAVSKSTRLCSISTVSQEKPIRAKNRAANIFPRDNQVPTAGWPDFRARLTAFGRMIFSLSMHNGDLRILSLDGTGGHGNSRGEGSWPTLVYLNPRQFSWNPITKLKNIIY